MDDRRADQDGGIQRVVGQSRKNDPARAEDDEYVEQKYSEVQDRIQAGMDALARRRALPLFG
jgi:hypothetical protein